MGRSDDRFVAEVNLCFGACDLADLSNADATPGTWLRQFPRWFRSTSGVPCHTLRHESTAVSLLDRRTTRAIGLPTRERVRHGVGAAKKTAVTTVHEILDTIRDQSATTAELGERFERLMLGFFRVEPTYAQQFSEVWMWGDWPGSAGRPDTGIDLVAKNFDDDGYTAIQCKCFSPEATLDKGDIDSFFTESGKSPFTQRIIVSTTSKWSVHAERSLHGQDKPVTRIGVEALEFSCIDWSRWNPLDSAALTRLPRKSPREHQIAAVEDVLEGFQSHDRGKLIMACGTGKTYTGQCIAERMVGPGGSVLVLVPSISLLSQTLKEWTADSDHSDLSVRHLLGLEGGTARSERGHFTVRLGCASHHRSGSSCDPAREGEPARPHDCGLLHLPVHLGGRQRPIAWLR